MPQSSSIAAPSESPILSAPKVGILGQLWSLLREHRASAPERALAAVRELYDAQNRERRLTRRDPPADFPTKGGGTSGGCSICLLDFPASTLRIVLRPQVQRTISGVMLFVIDQNGSHHAFESPPSAVSELNTDGELIWVLPASAAEMEAPLVRGWVRLAVEGETLEDEIAIIQ